MVQIAPSLLAADFADLGGAIRLVESAGADAIHVDVMDGHFVPNITMGPPVVASLRRVTTLPLDVHLMIEDPDAYIEPFASAGADWISVHVESCRHLDRTLQLIRSLGARPGVVVNPATSLSTLDEALPLAEYVLVMTVNPGFGGQHFLPYTLEKVWRLRKVIQHKGLPIRIEVDGGVCSGNVPDLVRSGASILVVGSQIFGAPDPVAAVRKLKALAEQCAIDPRVLA
ncbi:MAG: ribulose-phosphate 3-epimerase [Acidimicrobiia bacterium]|nr:ribulose-phosphate 3-epimerase [Acidimicrobiia bacterium]